VVTAIDVQANMNSPFLLPSHWRRIDDRCSEVTQVYEVSAITVGIHRLSPQRGESVVNNFRLMVAATCDGQDKQCEYELSIDGRIVSKFAACEARRRSHIRYCVQVGSWVYIVEAFSQDSTIDEQIVEVIFAGMAE
jgi:hypothetical protein